MKFVRTEDLKIGMRLAKPIYNNKGVLLYDRNSKLTSQSIESARNFKLIGIYILEAAEPLPPISEEDLEFEKFQMVSVFTVEDELQSMLKKGKASKIHMLVETIVRSYGRLDHKINFIQNLRSKEDFVYKHSLNVAILAALISHKMNMRSDETNDAILAALVHDVGKLNVDPNLLIKEDITEEELTDLRRAELNGHLTIEESFAASPNVKRAVVQTARRLDCFRNNTPLDEGKLINAAKVLIVAETYETMTAINSNGEPQSEIAVIKLLKSRPDIFDPVAVNALIKSINLLVEGSSVELSNGEKALVIAPNERDILRPMVLLFSSNTILDLAQTALYADIEVSDVMKTLDNRYVMVDRDEIMKNQD